MEIIVMGAYASIATNSCHKKLMQSIIVEIRKIYESNDIHMI